MMLHGTTVNPIPPIRIARWYSLPELAARRWMILSVAVFLLATALYIPYERHSEDGPHGGSWPGLIYGIVATVAMLVPMLIPLRNRIKALRVGKPAMWMQAHIWFGLISYPLALFHAGSFTWNGALAQALMWIFTGVMASGIFCFFLQRSLPTVTTLHSLTGDRRHAARQRVTQMWLNAWLFIHVPLAYTMLTLTLIHAIMSLRFVSPR